MNIKGVQTNLETTTLNLNTTGAGNTLIGTSGGSNSITINRPLTVGYNPSAITAGQIGYSIKYTWIQGSIPSGGSFTFGSFTNTPVGIYLLTVGHLPFFLLTLWIGLI